MTKKYVFLKLLICFSIFCTVFSWQWSDFNPFSLKNLISNPDTSNIPLKKVEEQKTNADTENHHETKNYKINANKGHHEPQNYKMNADTGNHREPKADLHIKKKSSKKTTDDENHNMHPFYIMYGSDINSQHFIDNALSSILQTKLDDLFSEKSKNSENVTQKNYDKFDINLIPFKKLQELNESKSATMYDQTKLDVCVLKLIKKTDAFRVIYCLNKKRRFSNPNDSTEQSNLNMVRNCLSELDVQLDFTVIENCIRDKSEIHFVNENLRDVHGNKILLPSGQNYEIPTNFIRTQSLNGSGQLLHQGEIIDPEKMQMFSEDPLNFMCGYMSNPPLDCQQKNNQQIPGQKLIEKNEPLEQILNKTLKNDTYKEFKGSNGSIMKLWKRYKGKSKNYLTYIIKVHISNNSNKTNDSLIQDIDKMLKDFTNSENILKEVDSFKKLKEQIQNSYTEKKTFKNQSKSNKNELEGKSSDNFSDVNLELSGKESKDGFVPSDYALTLDSVDDKNPYNDAVSNKMFPNDIPLTVYMGQVGSGPDELQYHLPHLLDPFGSLMGPGPVISFEKVEGNHKHKLKKNSSNPFDLNQFPGSQGKVHTNKKILIKKDVHGNEQKTVIEKKITRNSNAMVKTITIHSNSGDIGGGFGELGSFMNESDDLGYQRIPMQAVIPQSMKFISQVFDGLRDAMAKSQKVKAIADGNEAKNGSRFFSDNDNKKKLRAQEKEIDKLIVVAQKEEGYLESGM